MSEVQNHNIFKTILNDLKTVKKTKTDSKTLLLIFAVIAVIILPLLALFAVAAYEASESRITISESGINISGILYSASFSYENIYEVSLERTRPEVKSNINGYDLGSIYKAGKIYKGAYELAGFGKTVIFATYPKTPYVKLKLTGHQYSYLMINSPRAEDTYHMLDEINDHFNFWKLKNKFQSN